MAWVVKKGNRWFVPSIGKNFSCPAVEENLPEWEIFCPPNLKNLGFQISGNQNFQIPESRISRFLKLGNQNFQIPESRISRFRNPEFPDSRIQNFQIPESRISRFRNPKKIRRGPKKSGFPDFLNGKVTTFPILSKVPHRQKNSCFFWKFRQDR